MSLRAMLWSFDQAPRCLSTGERLVLLAIADHVDDDTAQAWPSINRLAARTGLDRRTVQRSIRQLQAQRILTVRDGGAVWRRADRRTSVYLWHPDKAKQQRQNIRDATLFDPVDNRPEEASERGGVVPPRKANGTSRGGVVPPRTGRRDAALTLIENQQEHVVTEVENVTVPRAREPEPVDNSGEGFAAFQEAREALRRRKAAEE